MTFVGRIGTYAEGVLAFVGSLHHILLIRSPLPLPTMMSLSLNSAPDMAAINGCSNHQNPYQPDPSFVIARSLLASSVVEAFNSVNGRFKSFVLSSDIGTTALLKAGQHRFDACQKSIQPRR